MALYKYSSNLQNSDHEAFDAEHNPGVSAPLAGIYKCTNCGDEIAIAGGHTLPPQNHKQHTTTLPIKWKLVVYAVQS
ncbi:protein L [Enterobacter mori]|uniref:protein L n=1 Tax=Enterobacter mori TaxID=539813 RepID=UPI001BDFE693|nr:protein L [Enterobacter mori]MBT1872809.1 protein L [Enterobacter mori]